MPAVSLTYWAADHDTCTADGEVSWDEGEEARRDGWARFASGPEPVGYDPSIIPGWTDPLAPDVGVLRIAPTRLRVMPGSVLLAGRGEVLRWRRG